MTHPSQALVQGRIARNIDGCQCLWEAALVPVADLLPVTDITACCAPITREAMPAERAEIMARTLKALADPARLRLLSMVASHEDNEACVCDLTEPLGLSQPTVSHHLKILVDAGFLTRSKRATWAYYRLVPGALDQVAGLLGSV
jgi:ArsR family transcriptional regulator, arsenate/arsenite/antimonite-responsive transcriptional repressor